MGNAANQRQIRKAKQREHEARRQALDDLRVILETRSGRRFVWRQLERSGVFQLSFVQGSADGTAFNEGRRTHGLALLADVLEINPKVYPLMAQEAADDARTQDPEPAPDTATQDEEEPLE